jgi:hypothetical protein
VPARINTVPLSVPHIQVPYQSRHRLIIPPSDINGSSRLPSHALPKYCVRHSCAILLSLLYFSSLFIWTLSVLCTSLFSSTVPATTRRVAVPHVFKPLRNRLDSSVRISTWTHFPFLSSLSSQRPLVVRRVSVRAELKAYLITLSSSIPTTQRVASLSQEALLPDATVVLLLHLQVISVSTLQILISPWTHQRSSHSCSVHRTLRNRTHPRSL